MADDPDNLVLARLREIRDMVGRVLEDTADIKLRITNLEATVAEINQRLDQVDERLKRLGRRTGILFALGS